MGSIARCNPSIATGRDPFAVGTPFFNAYDPSLFQDTTYLSDSCRAWRAGGLAVCWDRPPPRIYLLIHPEVWGDLAGIERLERDLRADLLVEVLQAFHLLDERVANFLQ